MAKSFILIEADEDFKETVKDAIRKHSAVSAVYTVVPTRSDEKIIYDIVVEVEADTRQDLDNAESEIRTRKEVRSTLTLEVIEKEERLNRSKNKYLQIG
jgi:putative lipoic acid-binding regulatory protein